MRLLLRRNRRRPMMALLNDEIEELFLADSQKMLLRDAEINLKRNVSNHGAVKFHRTLLNQSFRLRARGGGIQPKQRPRQFHFPGLGADVIVFCKMFYRGVFRHLAARKLGVPCGGSLEGSGLTMKDANNLGSKRDLCISRIGCASLDVNALAVDSFC